MAALPFIEWAAAPHTLKRSLTRGMCAGQEGGEAVLRRLSSKDRALAELHMRRVDLSLRHIPATPAAAGCIISGDPGQSFRRWLYRWIRQTVERCPHGAAPAASEHNVCHTCMPL